MITELLTAEPLIVIFLILNAILAMLTVFPVAPVEDNDDEEVEA